jgi:hypothetical protein
MQDVDEPVGELAQASVVVVVVAAGAYRRSFLRALASA